MHKQGRGKGSATPVQKTASKVTASSSSQPLRFKRKNKPTLKPYAIFEEDEEPAPPEDPQITLLKNKVVDLREEIRMLKAQQSDSNVKTTSIEFQLNFAIFSLRRSLGKVAQAAQVAYAFD
jgi:hypothetical protein